MKKIPLVACAMYLRRFFLAVTMAVWNPRAAPLPGPETVLLARRIPIRTPDEPFFKAALRRRIIGEIRAQNEQTIDRHSIDDVLAAGFDEAALAKAQAKVRDFRAWLVEHRDELTALQVLYAGTRPLRCGAMREDEQG